MDYSQLQSVLAANIQAQTIAERDYKKAQAEANKWEELYQRLLKGGQEDLIQEAQFYKSICAKKADNLKALLDEQTERVANLSRKLTVESNISPKSFTTSSISKSLDEKLQQIETRSQTIPELPANDLKKRLCKVESELINQQTAISKLLQQNSSILEDVRNILEETSFDGTFELSTTDAKTQLAGLEYDIDVDDIDAELENLRSQLDRL